MHKNNQDMPEIQQRKFEDYARQRMERLMAGLGARAAEAPIAASETDSEHFVERMRALVENMPVSHGGRYYCRFNVRIGIVCDEFLWDSWKDAADFVYIAPDQDPDVVLRDLDCFVVASAWRGLNNNEWQGMYRDGTPTNKKIYEFMSAAKRMGLHVVFYSKEDPPNYKWFLDIAKKADTVFTSAAEKIPSYKADCDNEDVHSLCFCINPICHNPVGTRFAKKFRDVVFSGSWMMKYPHRCENLAMMFDGVLLSGRKLTIIDRNYERRTDWHYAYPPDYQPYVNPAVDHTVLQKIHKLYDWALNINSVRESDTMFANRVYELQASGNLLISNYSLGVAKMIPTVFLASSRSSVKALLESFSEEDIYERQMSDVRRVMTYETCYDRIAQLLNTIGIDAHPTVRNVLVIANAVDEKLAEQFSRQTYPSKKLVEASNVTEEDYRWADIVAFFDSSCSYGAFYLEDMTNAFKYVDCDYITKAAFMEDGKLTEGPEHTYVSKIGDKCRTVFWRSSFSLKELLAMSGSQDMPGGYAIDHFNFAKGGARSTMPEQWQPKLSVIVPMRNNGWALYGRLFPSLKRASVFNDLEILVVDAGSDDGRSPQIAAQIAERFANVRLLEVNDKSCDSDAARNFGLAHSSAPYVMFVDPEVEVDARGLQIALETIDNGRNMEMEVGNSEECGVSVKVHNNYDLICDAADGKSATTKGAEVILKIKDHLVGDANVLYRIDFLSKHKLAHGGDVAFVEKAMKASKKCETLPFVISRVYK